MRSHFTLCAAMAAASLACTLATPAHAEYVAPALNHAPYGDVKVVVPITSDSASMWMFRLRNVGNGMQVAGTGGGSMQAKVVLYGPGVKMLVQPVDPKVKEVIDAARSAGVQINICNFTLKGMDVDWHTLYGVAEADVVPSGFAEVGWLASHGWAVDPAN